MNTVYCYLLIAATLISGQPTKLCPLATCETSLSEDLAAFGFAFILNQTMQPVNATIFQGGHTVIHGVHVNLEAGTHTIEIFGSEACSLYASSSVSVGSCRWFLLDTIQVVSNGTHSVTGSLTPLMLTLPFTVTANGELHGFAVRSSNGSAAFFGSNASANGFACAGFTNTAAFAIDNVSIPMSTPAYFANARLITSTCTNSYNNTTTTNACFQMRNYALNTSLVAIGPDSMQASSQIAIADSFYVQRLIVRVRGTHTFIGDLVFTLISPVGIAVPFYISNWPRCSLEENFDLRLADNATMRAPCPALNNTEWKADAPLQAFAWEQARGTWTLVIQDMYDGKITQALRFFPECD